MLSKSYFLTKNRSYLSIEDAIVQNNYIKVKLLKEKKLPLLKKNKKKIKQKKKIILVIQAIINRIIEKLPFVLEKKYKFLYWKLFFRYTGSNIYGTLTSRNGSVYYALSSGLFPKINKRKDKTTVFIAKELGEIFSLILYKYKITNIVFCPVINHRKVKSLLNYFFRGLHVLFMSPISRIDPIRKVIRNGVRLRKIPRK
jgi:hypothetical protein